MKRKILSGVLATTILATGLSATFANTENIISTTKTEVKKELTAEQKAKFEEYKRIKAKQKAGQTLTAEEQKILAEFKAKKAEKKLKKLENSKKFQNLTEEQKTKVKAILAKKKAGQTLTAEEQKLLDEFKAKKNKNS